MRLIRGTVGRARAITAASSSSLVVMTADQVISGASNVLIAVLVAREVSVAEFGRFGVVQLVYIILVGVSRALVSDLLLVNPEDARSRAGEAIGAIFVISTGLSLGLVAISLVILGVNPQLAYGLLILAACLPLLSLQDLGRFLGFATQRIGRALLLDVIWFVAMLVGVAFVLVAHSHSFCLYTAVWLGSGALSGVAVFAWYSVTTVRFGCALVRDTWQLGWRYLVMYGSMQGTSLGVVAEVGTIAGAVALGAVQGTLVLVRPFTTLLVAIQTVLTGDVARAAGSQVRVLRLALFGSMLMVAAAAVNAGILLILPAGVGRQLLGTSWHYVHSLLVPTGLEILGMGLTAGPVAALNGMKAMRQAMPVVWLTPPVLLTCAGVGAALNGAVGALWVIAAGQIYIGFLYWLALGVAMGQGAGETHQHAPMTAAGKISPP